MAKTMQFGCKKCGGVVTVEILPSSSHVDIQVKDGGRIYDASKGVEGVCPIVS
jgi:hypothetical protein